MDTTVQIITPDEVANGLLGKWTGNVAVQYVLDRAPFSHYWWDGAKLVPAVTPEAVQAAVEPVAPYPIGAALFEPTRFLRVDELQCVDSPYLAFSYWIKLRSAGAQDALWTSDPLGMGLTYQWLDGGKLQIACGDPPNEGTFQVKSDVALSPNVWHHVLGASKVNGPTEADMLTVLYIDGERVDVTIDYETDPFNAIAMNGFPFVLGNEPDMDLADFWLAVGQNLIVDGDIPEATRRKFTDADGWPVDLGDNGELPTGTAPTLFFHRDHGSSDSAAFGVNRGTGGSTDSTAWPMLASTSPTDPPTSFENPMFTPNDMIVGGTNGAPLRLAAPSNVGTFELRCVNGVIGWVAVS